MKITRCPVCNTKAIRVRGDYFRCPDCFSVWCVKGYSEAERRARMCPICGKYVDEDNRQTLYYTAYEEKGPLRYFHFDCHRQYLDEREEQIKELEAEIARLEVIAMIPCPSCGATAIATFPAGCDDVCYICNECDNEVTEEWLNKQIEERRQLNESYNGLERNVSGEGRRDS